MKKKLIGIGTIVAIGVLYYLLVTLPSVIKEVVAGIALTVGFGAIVLFGTCLFKTSKFPSDKEPYKEAEPTYWDELRENIEGAWLWVTFYITVLFGVFFFGERILVYALDLTVPFLAGWKFATVVATVLTLIVVVNSLHHFYLTVSEWEGVIAVDTRPGGGGKLSKYPSGTYLKPPHLVVRDGNRISLEREGVPIKCGSQTNNGGHFDITGDVTYRRTFKNLEVGIGIDSSVIEEGFKNLFTGAISNSIGKRSAKEVQGQLAEIRAELEKEFDGIKKIEDEFGVDFERFLLGQVLPDGDTKKMLEAEMEGVAIGSLSTSLTGKTDQERRDLLEATGLTKVAREDKRVTVDVVGGPEIARAIGKALEAIAPFLTKFSDNIAEIAKAVGRKGKSGGSRSGGKSKSAPATPPATP